MNMMHIDRFKTNLKSFKSIDFSNTLIGLYFYCHFTFYIKINENNMKIV